MNRRNNSIIYNESTLNILSVTIGSNILMVVVLTLIVAAFIAVSYTCLDVKILLSIFITY